MQNLQRNQQNPVVVLPDRFAMSAEDYLRQTGLDVYLSDCVTEILNDRHEQPLLAIQQYFAKIVNGANIHGREFKFIDATSRNRLSFIRSFESVFSSFDSEELLVAEDIHQLLCIICPDFPIIIVHSLLAPFQQRNLSYSTVSKCVSVYFFYRRFLEIVQQIFKHAGGNSSSADKKVTTGVVAESSNADDGNDSSSSGSSGSTDKNKDTQSALYDVPFSKSVVLGVLTTLFYEDIGGKSAMYYHVQTTSVHRSHETTLNDNNFEEAAGDMCSNKIIDKIGLCVPPFWSIQEAAIKAVQNNDVNNDGTVTWRKFLKYFLLNNKLLIQLHDNDINNNNNVNTNVNSNVVNGARNGRAGNHIKMHPPVCAIATSAVTSQHEAIPYHLMRALVSANVGTGKLTGDNGNSTKDSNITNKRNENSNSNSSGRNNEGRKGAKRRGKGAGRRR
jgi:hypothetical protein